MLLKSLIAIGATAIVGAGIGALLGWTVGTYAPDAYRAVVVTEHLEDFSPVQFGVGQGIIQGLLAGAFIALAVVVVVAWRDVRVAQCSGTFD